MPLSTLYNDNDLKVCAWLRELIAQNHLPLGPVFERPIEQLTYDDLHPYDNVHLFAGIGGWPYALQLAGWPTDRPVWTGSCPCQPFSCAGRGSGENDPRHLWPEMRRLITLCRPPTIFGEQVASKSGREWLARVRADLEGMGYAVGCADLCAAGVGAPHIRQRLFWVAYSQSSERGTELQKHSDSYRGNGSGGGGVISRLADDSSTRLEVRGQQPARQECRTSERSCPTCGALGECIAAYDDGAQDYQCQQHGVYSSRLEQPPGDGREQRGTKPSGRGAEPRCELGGVGEPWGRQMGPAGQSRGRPESNSGSKSYFWGFYDLIPCRDGKTRRIESGTFPLAHGVPARVGRLRGYGNAIVPQLAAEFVRAFMEAAL